MNCHNQVCGVREAAGNAGDCDGGLASDGLGDRVASGRKISCVATVLSREGVKPYSEAGGLKRGGSVHNGSSGADRRRALIELDRPGDSCRGGDFGGQLER